MDDDYEYGVPDPDYGDTSPTNPPRKLSAKEVAERDRWRAKRDAEEAQSRSFNSYMIELFNQRR